MKRLVLIKHFILHFFHIFISFKEWTTETNCLKLPYYPQIGDEVVYFRVGHQEYINAVKSRGLDMKGLKTYKYTETEHKDNEIIYAQVVDIEFESKKTEPKHFLKIELHEIDPNDDRLTINSFYIRYHRMEGISDFIILRQMYEKSLALGLEMGDEFRTTICGNYWTFGIIVGKSPFNDDFPESHFKSLVVNLTDNEDHRMSPWELEPIDRINLPEDRSPVPLINDERLAFYEPKAEDWPKSERQVECKRLEKGL